MGEVPRALHLDPELMEKLEREASLQHLPEADVAALAIAAYLDKLSYKRECLAAALVEADKGVFISSEAVLKWMEELDRNADAPPPEPDVFLPPRR